MGFVKYCISAICIFLVTITLAHAQTDQEVIEEKWKVIELSVLVSKQVVATMKAAGKDPEALIYETAVSASGRMATDMYTTVTLVQVELWSEEDMVEIFADGDTTLTGLRAYRENHLSPKIWSDATFLIVNDLYHQGSQIDGLFGVATICTMDGAGLLTYRSGTSDDRFAQFMAHELGHGIGCSHDTSSCYCSRGSGNCVMNSIMNNVQTQYSTWSSCSKSQYATNLKTETPTCLYNQPTWSYVPTGSSKCGNGVVEEGEECDCADACLDNCCQCCNSNCQLMSTAACAQGECCDYNTCREKSSGTVCRESQHGQCDAQEVCSGSSNHCPRDEWLGDAGGTDCTDENTGNEGYCKEGACQTRDFQCRQFWTDVHTGGEEKCYEAGVDNANRYANCGEDRSDSPFTYESCSLEGDPNYMCGVLNCDKQTSQNSLGYDASFFRSPQETNRYNSASMQQDINCRSLRYADWEYPLNGDQVRVNNGVKCGDGKACYNQRCVSTEEAYTLIAEEPVLEPTGYCGDGIVSTNEECDCGGSMSTCGCCDPSTCMILAAETQCLDNVCGKCLGTESTCTDLKDDLTPCDGTVGQCYKGTCISLNDQCHRYFDNNAIPATDVMTYNKQFNISQWNAGGYLMRSTSNDEWVTSRDQFAAATGDGMCGLLLCNTTLQAHVPHPVYDIDYTSVTFFLQPEFFSGTRCVFYLTELVRDQEEKFKKYNPVLVDQGSPCSVDGQRGYCETKNLVIDARKWTYYRQAICRVPEN